MAEFLIETHGAAELWIINGEARRNALSKAMVAELEEHVKRVSASKVRAVVITGAGEKAFCAGADLKERKTMSDAEVQTFLEGLNRTLRALEQSDTVFIAHLNGAAFGGGTELALSCDLRVMAPTAQMGLTEVTLGIIPGAGGTQRLPRLIGRGRAKDLILTGRKLNAEQSLHLGLVEHVGDRAVALDLAKTICGNAPIAVALAKHAIDEGLALDLDKGLALEWAQYQKTLGTEDRQEGLKAFAEKRKPVYRGK